VRVRESASVSLAARWMPRFGDKICNICLFQPLSTQGRRDGGAPSEKYAALGACAGIISDKIGRRNTLIYSIAAYSLLTIPIYFSTGFEQFAFFRVLAGVGLGACIPVVTTIFSESTPTSRRALFITFGMAWMIVGWVLGGLIPTLLVPHYGWRVCYLIGGVPFLYAVFLYFRMRESAYWLANKGRKKEAVEFTAI